MAYVDYMGTVGTGLMNADHQGTGKVILLIRKYLKGPPMGPKITFESLIPCLHQRNSFTEQLNDLMPVVKNITVMDVTKDRTTSIDETKSSVGDRKQVFCQTTISYQKPKLKNANKWN